MIRRSLDANFRRYQRTRDARALGRVFDGAAPELLRLARHFAPAADAADDLVQETFLTAIEATDQFDSSRAIMPWLVGILANHARLARRRARRAIDPQRVHAPLTTASVDPASVAAARDTRATIETTIDRLAEASRIALRLYLFDGLEPSEIAQRLERPAGTVRSQISRGLEELRRALPQDTRLADRHAQADEPHRLRVLRAAVLAWQSPTAAPTAATSTGATALLGAVILMNKKWIGIVVVLALGVGVWFATNRSNVGDADATDPPDPITQRTAASPDDEVERRTDAPSEAEHERARVVDAREAEPATQKPALPEHGSLRVRVRYGSTDAPVVGQRVIAFTESGPPDLVARLAAPVTDTTGIAVIERLAPGICVVTLDGRGDRHMAKVQAGQQRDVELVLRGATIFGTVRDPNGVVVAGAQIVLHDGSGGSSVGAISDASGRFECLDVVAGVAVQAQKTGHVASLVHPTLAQVGTREQIDLQLRGVGRRLLGRVTDSDGEPARGALVGILSRADDAAMRGFDRVAPRPTPRFLLTDGDGRFETDEVATTALMVAAAPGDAASSAAFGAAEVQGGDTDALVEIVLPRGGEISGVVSDAGRPVAGAMLIAWLREPLVEIGHLLNLLGNFQATSDAEGRYRLRRLPPGVYELSVHGKNLQVRHEIALEVGQHATWDPGAKGGASLRVAVTIAPAAAPHASNPHGARYVVLLRPGSTDAAAHSVLMGMTGLDGRCEFTGLESPVHTVQVLSIVGYDPRNTVLCAQRDRVATVGESVLEIELGVDEAPSARFVGRVLRDGLVLPNARVIVNRRHAQFAAELTLPVDEAGEFSVGALPPGDYVVHVESADRSMRRSLDPRSLTLGQLDDLGDIELSR